MEQQDIMYFAAGGAVRDLLLGRAYRDVDFTFAGSEKDFIQRNPSARKLETGNSAIYFLHGQEYGLLQKSGMDLRKAIESDLLRRDFTINSLLLSPSGILHAHPQALCDLRKKWIRPASASSLADDPVRVLRAARFCAALPDFRLHDESLEQMRALGLGGGLSGIAAEQAGKECLKACSSPRPGNFLRALAQADCLDPWFAEFARGGNFPAGPPQFHRDSVLEHTAEVMDGTAAFMEKLPVRKDPSQTPPGQGRDADFTPGPPVRNRSLTSLAVWMAFCHDVGKTATPDDVLPRHLGHETRGRDLALALGARLRLPSLYIKAGALCASLHMKAASYDSLRPGTRVDLLTALRPELLARPFAAVVALDSGAPLLAERIVRDLDSIAQVTLPPEWRNKGKSSGERLRQMRCELLAAR